MGYLAPIWNINTDGSNWYATTVAATTPVLYQLWLGSIPSHRQFIAEQGIVIEGQGVLQDLPNAQFLGTDAWGNIIAKTAPVVGGGYTSTMYIANASQTLAPNLISRSELIVLFVPIVDTNVTANTSTFGTFLSQGGTGNLRYTLRDEQYRLIGYSAQITNPTPVFTELTCTNLFDPVTQSPLTSYNLLAGERYYLGVLWDANGIQIVGDDAVQTVNTNPLPAFKIDNLASMTPLAVLGSDLSQRCVRSCGLRELKMKTISCENFALQSRPSLQLTLTLSSSAAILGSLTSTLVENGLNTSQASKQAEIPRLPHLHKRSLRHLSRTYRLSTAPTLMIL